MSVPIPRNFHNSDGIPNKSCWNLFLEYRKTNFELFKKFKDGDNLDKVCKETGLDKDKIAVINNCKLIDQLWDIRQDQQINLQNKCPTLYMMAHYGIKLCPLPPQHLYHAFPTPLSS